MCCHNATRSRVLFLYINNKRIYTESAKIFRSLRQTAYHFYAHIVKASVLDLYGIVPLAHGSYSYYALIVPDKEPHVRKSVGRTGILHYDRQQIFQRKTYHHGLPFGKTAFLAK